MTQTLVIHVIRTRRVPFVLSRASWALVATTALVIATGAWLPFSPLALALGLVALPAAYWPVLVLTLLAYCLATQGPEPLLLRGGRFTAEGTGRSACVSTAKGSEGTARA